MLVVGWRLPGVAADDAAGRWLLLDAAGRLLASGFGQGGRFGVTRRQVPNRLGVTVAQVRPCWRCGPNGNGLVPARTGAKLLDLLALVCVPALELFEADPACKWVA